MAIDIDKSSNLKTIFNMFQRLHMKANVEFIPKKGSTFLFTIKENSN